MGDACSNKKSVSKNAVLNTFKQIVSLVFPMITFPYASRVLGVESLGKYNFSASIVSYFSLLVGLGISTYIVREGAAVRDDRDRLENLVGEVFSINLYSLVISYVILILCVFSLNRLRPYAALIFILSVQTVFAVFGRGWLYSIFENYFYITVRTVVFQFLSVIVLFLFVRDSNDIIGYCIFSIFGSIGSDILNIVDSRKFCRFKFFLKPSLKHLKPILLIFSTSVSVVIYVSSDTTILGMLCNDYSVGLYGVSVKIYNIVKQVAAASLIVTLPRFAYYIGQGDKQSFDGLFNKTLQMLLTITLPIVVGVCVVCREAVIVVAGAEYREAYISLFLLSIALVFNLFAYVIGYGILIPMKKEKVFFIATVLSAIVNVVLNLWLIPHYQQNAAAFTTIISEALVAILCAFYARKHIHIEFSARISVAIAFGLIWIIVVCLFLKRLISNDFLLLTAEVFTSAIGYFTIEILMKNTAIYGLVEKFKGRKKL